MATEAFCCRSREAALTTQAITRCYRIPNISVQRTADGDSLHGVLFAASETTPGGQAWYATNKNLELR